MTTKREIERQINQRNTLVSLGFTPDEAEHLRRISNTLRRWYELECGTDYGCICRDDETDKPYWLDAFTGRRTYAIPDREKGAIKRLDKIITARNERHYVVNTDYYGLIRNDLAYYLQTDPRGAALYILRPGDVPPGENADAYYSRGVCVY